MTKQLSSEHIMQMLHSSLHASLFLEDWSSKRTVAKEHVIRKSCSSLHASLFLKKLVEEAKRCQVSM